MSKITATEIRELNRNYSLYTISSRAIPHLTDGLKPAARRLLWKAKEGKRFKTATLCGSTLDIHPHGLPESAANTLAAFYGNNIPLMDGDGAFGTIVDPTEYGATRYTYMQVSAFTKDCMFRDIEIIPDMPNYDGSTTEPMHFLPLVPIVVLNPQEGMATGFACNILPRSLDDIIKSQLNYLKGKKFKEPAPTFLPTENKASEKIIDKKGVGRWKFDAQIEVVNTSNVKIKTLPYNVQHSKYKAKLHKMIEDGVIASFSDDSKDKFSFNVTFKRGALRGKSDDEIRSMLGLSVLITENLNVVDFGGKAIYPTSYSEIIEDFSDWRLSWYKTRYQNLKALLEIDIQRYQDIITAIDNDVGSRARDVESRTELTDLLKSFGIVSLDYIANLPVYRFTLSEKQKTQDKLTEALKTIKHYNKMLKSEALRLDLYCDELTELLANYKKGKYSQNFY